MGRDDRPSPTFWRLKPGTPTSLTARLAIRISTRTPGRTAASDREPLFAIDAGIMARLASATSSWSGQARVPRDVRNRKPPSPAVIRAAKPATDPLTRMANRFVQAGRMHGYYFVPPAGRMVFPFECHPTSPDDSRSMAIALVSVLGLSGIPLWARADQRKLRLRMVTPYPSHAEPEDRFFIYHNVGEDILNVVDTRAEVGLRAHDSWDHQQRRFRHPHFERSSASAAALRAALTEALPVRLSEQALSFKWRPDTTIPSSFEFVAEQVAGHYPRHHALLGCTNPEEYVQRAIALARCLPGADIIVGREHDGDIEKIRLSTGECVVYRPSGEIRTFFRRSKVPWSWPR